MYRNQHRPLHKATKMREGFDVSPERLELDFLFRQWQSLLSEEQLNSAGPSEKGVFCKQDKNKIELKIKIFMLRKLLDWKYFGFLQTFLLSNGKQHHFLKAFNWKLGICIRSEHCDFSLGFLLSLCVCYTCLCCHIFEVPLHRERSN